MGLTSPRLVLRAWEDADRQPFAEMSSDPDVMKYLLPLPTRQASDAWIDRQISHLATHGFCFWAVASKPSGEFMGAVGCFASDMRRISRRLSRWAGASLDATGVRATRQRRRTSPSASVSRTSNSPRSSPMRALATMPPALSWRSSGCRAIPLMTSIIPLCRRAALCGGKSCIDCLGTLGGTRATIAKECGRPTRRPQRGVTATSPWEAGSTGWTRRCRPSSARRWCRGRRGG